MVLFNDPFGKGLGNERIWINPYPVWEFSRMKWINKMNFIVSGRKRIQTYRFSAVEKLGITKLQGSWELKLKGMKPKTFCSNTLWAMIFFFFLTGKLYFRSLKFGIRLILLLQRNFIGKKFFVPAQICSCFHFVPFGSTFWPLKYGVNPIIVP